MGWLSSLFGGDEDTNPSNSAMQFLNQIPETYNPLKQQFQNLSSMPGERLNEIGGAYQQSPGFQHAPPSSGGQRSRVIRMDSKMLVSGSCNASRISSERMVNVLGRPELKSRPFTSMVNSCSSGNAEPMRILISSAVRSPIIKL